MRRRHHLPSLWLFTDPRMGERLWDAIARLPDGSGIVFRHYDHPRRAELAARVAAIARRKHHMLVIAGDARLARRVGAAGTHLPARGPVMAGVVTAAAHGRAGIVRARRAGAVLVFVSPVFKTRSHGDAAGLGPLRFGLMVRGTNIDVAALGGMTAQRFHRLQSLGSSGWGAIDAWLGTGVNFIEIESSPRPSMG